MAAPAAKIVTVALSAALAGGCSLGMATVANDWHPSTPPRCSDSTAAPLGDLLLGGLSVAIHPVLALPWVLSSLKGFKNTSTCSKAKAQHAEWVQTYEREPTAYAEAEQDDEPAGDETTPIADEAPALLAPEAAARAKAEAEARQQAEAEVDGILAELQQAEERAAQRETERRAGVERRAWSALSSAERRRWQQLPARARAVVRQRAIARQVSIDDQREQDFRRREAPELERLDARLREARARLAQMAAQAEVARQQREREATEQAARERAAAEQAARDREAAEQARADQAARERETAEQARADQAARERAEAERARAEQAHADERARLLEDERRREEERKLLEAQRAAERERAREQERQREAERRRKQRDDSATEQQPTLEITGSKPDRGSADGGDMVTILGTGFAAYKGKPLDVYFGKRQATVIGLSGDTKLVVETPPGDAGSTVTIRLVLGNQRQLSLVSAFTYE